MYKMLAHVKHGNECGDRVMEFSSNHIFTVNNVIENNVIEKARLTYGRKG